MNLETIKPKRHRIDLDGLRAIAVLGVFLYHLEPRWLPGGFIGVDVFFVLSGYLITGVIFQSISKGTFSFVEFYQRRIARIFPALATMLIVVLFVSHWVYPREDISSIGSAVAAASAGLANMKFMMQGSYFKVIPDTQPLLHTWSLGVEEQFYLVFPFLLVFLRRCLPSAKALHATLWALGITSYFGCVVTSAWRPNIAFYFMPTRAWELILGALLASSEMKSITTPRATMRLNRYTVSIVGILACMYFVSESQFPGWIAMLPVALTVQTIADGEQASHKSLAYRFVCSDLMVYVGRLSYSLYLWHWPVFCFIDYTMLEVGWLQRCTWKAVLAIVCALVSFYLLEVPIRRELSVKKRRKFAYLAFALGSMLIVTIGYLDWRNSYLNASIASISSGGRKFVYGSNGPTVVLYGDSVASSQATAVSKVVQKVGGTFFVTSSAGSIPFPPSSSFENFIRFLSGSTAIDTVIIACAWHNYVDDPERIAQGLKLIQRKTEATILLVGPAPFLPKEATRESLRERWADEILESEVDRVLRLRIEDMLSEFQAPKVVFLKASSVLLTQDNRIRFYTNAGRQVYQDYLHLSSYGSSTVWDNAIASELIGQGSD